MLVNYDYSDSDNEATDDEEVQSVAIISNPKSVLSLPKKIATKLKIDEEEEDEFLKKKATPSILPAKPTKVKITIPRLSDFKEDEDEDSMPKKVLPVNRKNGLLGLLPKPSSASHQTQTKLAPVKSVETSKAMVTPQPPPKKEETPKNKGFVPYALMSHNPKNKPEPDIEEHQGSFFFSNEDDDLPQVNDSEVQALVAQETARMELRKRQLEGVETAEVQEVEFAPQEPQKNESDINPEAMRMLMGGNKAKRARIDEIQIIDISSNEVLPDKNEWMRKTLAGETSYVPTGNIIDKGPNALSKRKHQISYLSMRAENNVAELEAMWAANRSNKRETKSKYGF